MRRQRGLIIKKSESGLGLYTTKPIKRGDFVIEYTGEKITVEESDRRGGKYLFTVKKNLVRDGKGRSNTARYLNHSCRPNCVPEIDERAEKINIYTKRAVEAGEELTYNYGRGYWLDHIGARKCRCVKCKERRRR